MSVKVEKLEKSMVKLTITEPADKFEEAVKKVYNRQKSRIQIPGFRKGKAPLYIIEKEYGEGVFYEDAANELINSTYTEEAKASGEDITSMPKIGVEQLGHGKDFVYTAEVAVRPECRLGEYKGIEVTKQDASVTEDEVKAEIDKELDRQAKFNDITDRPVKAGDQIKLDFTGTVDGEEFKGGKGTDYPLTIGSGSFIPGFEDQLVGAEIGKDLDVNVTFPENYQAKELAGKAAVFHCVVKSIREKIVPELTDELVDEISETSKTVDEYKEEVRSKLQEKKDAEVKTEYENEAVDKIAENLEVEIPPAMLQTQADQLVDEWGQRFQAQGLSLDQYFQYTGSDRKSMAETLKPEAEKRIRTRLALEEIVKAENIEVSDEDYEAEIKKMADQYRMEPEKIKQFITDEQSKELRKDIAVQKAVDFVYDHVTPVEKKEEPKDEKADTAEAEKKADKDETEASAEKSETPEEKTEA